jgi:hypothetical protein
VKKLVASARRIGITLATLALLHASARADQELATDRPDFTETSWTVGSRTLQLETGFTLAQPADGSPHEVSAPELLMRVGIASRVEARLGFDRQWRDAAGLRNEGSLGAKIQLLDASSPLGLALIPAVAWPLWTDESDGFDDRARVAEVALAWSGGLAEPWSIGGMVGSELASDPVHQATVSIGRALGGRHGDFLRVGRRVRGRRGGSSPPSRIHLRSRQGRAARLSTLASVSRTPRRTSSSEWDSA